MTTERLGWGVIGVGRRARDAIIPALLASPSARVIGVVSRDPKQAEEAVKDWPELKVYPDYERMLSDPRVQVIYIASPHFLHVPQAVQALEAGKHVFMESPLALSVDGAHKLVEKARQRKVKLGVAFPGRFHSAIKTAAAKVRAGELGEIIHVMAVCAEPVSWPPGWWLDANRAGPPALMRLGVPSLDLAIWLQGKEVSELLAFAQEAEDPPVNSLVSILLGFADHSQGFALGASNFAQPEYSVQVEGRQGRISVQGDLSGQGSVILRETRPGEETIREFEPEDPVGQMLDAFSAAVASGADFSPDGREGKRLVALTCAAIESMKGRRLVRFGEAPRLSV